MNKFKIIAISTILSAVITYAGLKSSLKPEMTPTETYAAGWRAGQTWAVTNLVEVGEMGDYFQNSGWEDKLKADTIKLKNYLTDGQ